MECAIDSKVYKVYGKNTTLEGHAEEGIHGFHDFSNGWHCYMTSLGTSSYPGYQKVRAKNTT